MVDLSSFLVELSPGVMFFCTKAHLSLPLKGDLYVHSMYMLFGETGKTGKTGKTGHVRKQHSGARAAFTHQHSPGLQIAREGCLRTRGPSTEGAS